MTLLRFITAASLVSAVLAWGAEAAHAQIRSFVPIHRYVVGGSVAEIIDASPDGNTLVFTNAGDRQVGFIDITDPRNPQSIGTIEVDGEPTSVAITPNGRYAIAAVLDLIDSDAGETIADQQPGVLVVIDMATRQIVGEVPLLGIGPDSLDISPDGRTVVVAIEDEEDTDNLPGTRPGSLNLVALNYDNLAQSVVTSIALDLTGLAGVNYAADPQPEFVKFSPDGELVAVTLQENNAIALIDVDEQSVVRIFSAGTSVHERADLTEDGEISLTEAFEGRREPDAILFTPDGKYLLTANEGDTDRDSFGDDIWSGGRGWSLFDLEGNVIYDSRSSAEALAVQYGQYPDDRSENRGIEMEGAAIAEFGDRPLAFVASERGSFVLAYDLNNPRLPRLISFLPTGLAPEGVLALPERNLLLTSNEGDGTIDFFEASEQTNQAAYRPTEPLLMSTRLDLPFSAISGLHQGPDRNTLYAVPDNAIAPSRIFQIQVGGPIARVVNAIAITKNGDAMAYDLEGITVNPAGGFWLVSEGDDRDGSEAPNLLIQVNSQGEVQREIALPAADAAAITRFGFEGVTTSADGSKVYIAVQREFEGDPANTVRIAEYDVRTNAWAYYFYPLDTDNVDESWVGLSEIARDVDGSLLVVERDNQGGVNGAANARIKRIYRISLEGVQPGATLQKTRVVDLLDDFNWLEEKIESLAVTSTGYWVASDNDGGITTTRLLFLPRR